jgi:hypothetical protein
MYFYFILNRHFCQMSPEAQDHLLTTNTPLFNQFHLVCCLLDPRESPTPDPLHLQQLYTARYPSKLCHSGPGILKTRAV